MYLQDRAELYLRRRRNTDETTALRRIRATAADLRVWRRDPEFRESERAALAAPRVRAQVIDLNRIPSAADDSQQLARLRRMVAADQATAEDRARLKQLESKRSDR